MTALLEDLPAPLQAHVDALVAADETVEVRLKGAFKEALIYTDRRVAIVKTGFMTGAAFGANVFQMPYRNVTSVDVRQHLFSGYLEIASGGVQMTEKSFWSTDPDTDAKRAPNCISLVGRAQAERFRAAARFIMDRANALHADPGPDATPASKADEIRKLSDLMRDGLLTPEEFAAQKAVLLQGATIAPPSHAATPPEADAAVPHSIDQAIRRAVEERARLTASLGETRPVFGKRVS